MDTFLTILIWFGSGFAFAFGVFCGMLMIAMAKPRADPYQQRTVELMENRNNLDEQKVEAMRRIVDELAAIERR